MAGYAFQQRRLVSQEDAALIRNPAVPRSKFTGSWTRKTTFNAGDLVPILVEEVLPGDHLKYDITAYVRMSTPLFPMFDNQRVDTFLFFVPNRLLWANWEKFMGEQDNPGDSINFTVPIVTSPAGGFAANGVFDHMGIPVVGQLTAGQTISVSALPLRAYNLIWQEWFRDENLQNQATLSTGDSANFEADFPMRKRGKAHDYFTTCLPWPQKFTAPAITSPVSGIGVMTPAAQAAAVNVFDAAIGTTTYTAARTGPDISIRTTGTATVPDVRVEWSINTFRQAMLVQALLERDARGGTRYVEILKSHFDVTSPDFRLQRPEYFGGGSSPLTLTPIANTSNTNLGGLGAAGTAVGSHRGSYAATEHGYIIGLINVRSELSYSQGLHRMWTRSSRYDFYWPSLAELGEQAVLRQEIYCTGTDAEDATVFGYQERWHEYRTRTSEVTGMFRPTTTGNIAQWHLSERFTAAPVLGNTFIQDNPDMTRVLAAGGSANNLQYLADILFRREAVRPVPMYGTPVTLGRF